MKYTYINEISKYFKPVDYIEELTPEEKERRELQNYYADNMNRIKEFAENFNPDTDRIVFTFYKTLYQTGEKKTVEYPGKYNLSELNITGKNVYSYILCETIHLIYAILCSGKTGMNIRSICPDLDFNYLNTDGLNEYTGISAEIVREIDGETMGTLTVIYIPDVSKYDALACSGFTNTGHLSCLDTKYNDQSVILGNYFDGNSLNIILQFRLDDMRLNNISYKDTCNNIITFIDSAQKYKNEFNISLVSVIDTLLDYYDSTNSAPAKPFNNVDSFITDINEAAAKYEQSQEIVKFAKHIQKHEYSKGTTMNMYIQTMDTLRSLFVAINAVKYWNIDIKKYIAGNKFDNPDIRDYMLSCISENFGYTEYLNNNSDSISEQLNSFCNAVKSCLNIPNINLELTYFVPSDKINKDKDRILSSTIHDRYNKIWQCQFTNLRWQEVEYTYKPGKKFISE